MIWFGLAVAAFATLGWAEDARGLSVRTRLGGQVLISTVKPVVYGSVRARLARVPKRYAMITGLGHAYTTETPRHRVVRAIMNTLNRVGLSSCGKVFFQNPDYVEQFVSSRVPRDPSKFVRTNGSGVDTALFSRRPLPSGEPVFLLIGRLLIEIGEASHTVAEEKYKVTKVNQGILEATGL